MNNIFSAFIIMFVPIFLVYGIIQFLFFKNWTSVYTALDDNNYFKAIGKLKQEGIPYRTKSLFNLTTTPMFGGNRQRHYEIFVKKEDVNRASHQLHY